MIKVTKTHLLFAVAGVFALTAVGCVSEDSTPAAPTRDASFVGYSNPDTKQTTCGNCHVDVQAEWAQTKHASAWADLQASGHASEACNKCHTVNGLTNGTGDSTGFFTVSADAQRFYQDVQCESCHGPGANHISAPGESQPIPTFKVFNDYSNGCAACHNSSHHPFAEQLAISRHGEMPNWEGAAGGCQVNCHTVWGAQTQMAARGPYRAGETGVNPLTTTLPPGLTCSLCHEPHNAADNPAQLRAPFSLAATSTADSSRHLCGKCHSRGAAATASSWKSSRGGHSGQFADLMGTGGWTPAALFGNIQGPARHGTMEGNCVTCHMHNAPVNDASGNFAVQNVGHSWELAPCLNAASLGTGGIDTTAAGCTEAQRDFSACATSNCHGSQESARRAMDLLQNEIKAYAALLWVDGDGDAAVDSFPIDTGWLPVLLQHDRTRAAGQKRLATTGPDTVETIAKGARFNVLTWANPTRHGDGSYGVHNPAYIRLGMAKTVTLMRSTYAVTDTLAGVPPAVEAMLTRALAVRR
jgi:hypothetical protein